MKTVRLVTALLAVAATCTFAPSAMALTRAQQAAKAAGQASFQCFTHSCSRYTLLGVSGPRNGLMLYRFRYFNMHGVRGKNYSHCDQLIMVSQSGTISQFKFYSCG
ncbi:MAG: hypothetical protein QOJ85_4577 [Solirubrobacteraceae bacterium]|nr:hypothetical protein [Solirubrobacteraceae bacterium]